MIRVKATCNWANNTEIRKRLIDQFDVGDLSKEIEFVEDEDYDLLVAFGYITEIPNNNQPLFVFPQEPTWSGGHQKNFPNLKNLKVFGYDKKNYSIEEQLVETVSHMFYGGTGPWQEGWDFWNYNNIKNYEFTKTKDFCAFISNRGIDHREFSEGCLYPDRIKLVKSINEKVPYVDFYGWGDGNGKNLKPFALKKWESLKEYKFCLTIENSNEQNYLSEKFYDCILTDTVPIYFGCKNIEEIWSEKGYIKLDSLDNDYVIKKLDYIKDNSDKIYEEYLPEIQKMKKKYFDNFNIIKKIKKEYDEL